MVNPYYVIELCIACDAVNPPAEAILFHMLVIIQRIAPELTILAEIIGGYAGYLYRYSLSIKLKILRSGPDIRRIERNIDWHISDELHSVFVSVDFKMIPLLEEKELDIDK